MATLNQSSPTQKTRRSKKTTIDLMPFFCPGRICQFTWLFFIAREITWIFHVTCEFIFLSGQICTPVHIIHALLSTYSYVRKSTYPYPKIHPISMPSIRWPQKEMLRSPDICPATDRPMLISIISSDHFSSLNHQPPAPITHCTIILTLLPSVHRPGLVCTVSS